MTVRNLGALFRPESVAVIGASPRPGSFGAMVWARLLEGGFEGPVWPVNPKYAELDGHTAFTDAGDLPEAPTVALICTAPATWPDIVGKLGGLGTRAAIIVGEARSADDRAALARTLAAARPHLLRVVGPGSVGVVSPALRAHLGAPSCSVREGGVAWVSQSNALTNAVLGWAHARGLGFSHAVALGDEADVDAGDVLDYLASDSSTRAILLELKSVRAARKFMSAARAAARNKPVLALRSGRADPADALYTAVFQRAGMVRVDSLDDLSTKSKHSASAVSRRAMPQRSSPATAASRRSPPMRSPPPAARSPDGRTKRRAQWPTRCPTRRPAIRCCSATTHCPSTSARRFRRWRRIARPAPYSSCTRRRTARPSPTSRKC